MGVLKGFKVSDMSRSRIVGVACNSLTELVDKGKTKLKIPKKKNIRVFLVDGTEVESEEYFQSLPSQTIFLLKQDHESVLTGADLIYNALRYVNIEMIRAGEKVQQFFDENIKEKVRVLAEMITEKGNENNCKTLLSDRADDPSWFIGLETNAKTKEAFMFRRSQERIRGYLYKTKSDMKKTDLYMNSNEVKRVLDDVFVGFATSLCKDKYFGCLFDRSAEGALCDKQGHFKCSGIWKNNECSYNEGKHHVINPYSSREERIVFSTWNLDHCVERSRSIIPALKSAAELVAGSQDQSVVNVPYFYSLLFTRHNLRLVHIVCHDKGNHYSAKCDPKKLTIFISWSVGHKNINVSTKIFKLCSLLRHNRKHPSILQGYIDCGGVLLWGHCPHHQQAARRG